jgi:hypothetical protein
VSVKGIRFGCGNGSLVGGWAAATDVKPSPAIKIVQSVTNVRRRLTGLALDVFNGASLSRWGNAVRSGRAPAPGLRPGRGAVNGDGDGGGRERRADRDGCADACGDEQLRAVD